MGRAETTLKELKGLLPDGFTNTYEEEITLAARAASNCDWSNLATNLMNIGWWSQELTGKINAMLRSKKITELERYRIGNTIVRLEGSLIEDIEEALTKSCSCSFK